MLIYQAYVNHDRGAIRMSLYVCSVPFNTRLEHDFDSYYDSQFCELHYVSEAAFRRVPDIFD